MEVWGKRDCEVSYRSIWMVSEVKNKSLIIGKDPHFWSRETVAIGA